MEQAHKSWIYCCLIITIFIAIAIIPFEPISGIIFTIFSLLLLGAAYIRATKEPRSPTRSTSVAGEVPSKEKPELVHDLELVQVQVLEEGSSEPQSSLSPSQEKPLPDEKTSLEPEEKLRQRIDKLEKRVQSLQQQLAEEPLDELKVDRNAGESVEPIPSEPPRDELALSALAVDAVLEALEEKLAKGAITKQLYDRLRDKYIARMEKAKKRHKAPSTRGTKESLTGE